MFTSLSTTILLASALLIPSITADFHLMRSNRYYPTNNHFSCPSNYYNSKCWCEGDRRSTNQPSAPETQSNGEQKLRLENVCGVAALDLWWRPNGVEGDDRVRWQAYVPNASGNVEATCYDNGGAYVGEDCFIWDQAIQHSVWDGHLPVEFQV
ncbi:Increased rDNA silencing protein [Neocucurbitaria cava]|uniref:Increased rDNA silencing protein n=1 Tax=Neocucurbitaria cava TaxID=798079 RepID=A0A9W8YAQ4_9PLEO|nr:Increased rDNA silencing protein [Neocucurbitaria cava]